MSVVDWSYKNLMSDIDKINEIFKKKANEWTQEEKDRVTWWTACNHPFEPQYYVGGNDDCNHDYEYKYLLTSTYQQCKLCGDEKDDR